MTSPGQGSYLDKTGDITITHTVSVVWRLGHVGVRNTVTGEAIGVDISKVDALIDALTRAKNDMTV